ncbi:uncharacterized protein [Miscanthus floridulus]|uniref:uncharacterized protein isoform X2 n=1 Tax=Miscanthus floridulus TaxID=154761 RepID=UPI003457F575
MLQSYDFHCDRYLLRLLVFQQLRICLLSEDSVLMNLVKHQVLENTRDACIFSLPSMVRFLLVLAWVVIQVFLFLLSTAGSDKISNLKCSWEN